MGKQIDFYKYQVTKINCYKKGVLGAYVWDWGRDCDGVEAAAGY